MPRPLDLTLAGQPARIPEDLGELVRLNRFNHYSIHNLPLLRQAPIFVEAEERAKSMTTEAIKAEMKTYPRRHNDMTDDQALITLALYYEQFTRYIASRNARMYASYL